MEILVNVDANVSGHYSCVEVKFGVLLEYILEQIFTYNISQRKVQSIFQDICYQVIHSNKSDRN